MDKSEVLFTIACCTMALLAYLAPVMSFFRAWSVVAYSPYAYLFTLVTSGLWVIYAMDWGLTPLGWLSRVGACVSAIYVGIFLWFSDHADRRRTYLLRWIAGGTVLLLAAIAFHFIVGGKSTVFNVLCCAAACFSSLAPFYNVRTALQEKSMRTMPSIFIPAFALPNALVWTLRNTKFRATTDDVDGYLVVASVVAALCAFGQLVLHAIFWTPPPPPGDLEENLLPPGDNGGESTDSEGGALGKLGDLDDENELGDPENIVDPEVLLPPAVLQPQLIGVAQPAPVHLQQHPEIAGAALPPQVQLQLGALPAPVHHQQLPENAFAALPPPVQQQQAEIAGAAPPALLQQQQQQVADVPGDPPVA
ncbi:hypothetical protein ACQ4PT_068594 [Festuca glaucescens]